MPDLTILKELIKHQATVPLTDNGGRYSVTLTEPDEPSSSVTIHGLPATSIVIKADMFKSPDNIFSGSKSECRRADYVIIAETNTKKRILYIEMKKTKALAHAVIEQLAGARCFVMYCQHIGMTFWKNKDFLKNHQHRFVSFYHTGIPKGPTKIDRNFPLNDTPEKVMKISSPSKPQFNHLVGA